MILINQKLDDFSESPEVVKYYIGTAVMFLPFFGAASLYSYIFNYPVDGYSLPFPVFISLGTLFYLLLGLYFLSRFLRFWQLPEWIICTVLITVSLGTVGYYTVIAPGWSHIPAFFLVSLILFQIMKLYANFNSKSLIILIASSSFLFFVRPTDIMVLILFPFFGGNWKNFMELMKTIFLRPGAILIGVIIALIPLACQLAIYKVSTGNFIIWSYKSEGFDFLNPQIFNVLFSYSKGLFVYTPLSLIALFGLIPLFRRYRFLCAGIILYLAVNIWMLSSWWCWNYGCTFGTRAFIALYPIFFLLLAFLLRLNVIIRALTIVLIAFFSFVSVFQMVQAEKGILDLDFKTEKKGFWHTFLRLDRGYSGQWFLYLTDETPQNVLNKVTYFNDLEQVDTTWLNNQNISKNEAYSGQYSSCVSQDQWYSIGKKINWESVPYDKNVLIRVTAWYLIPVKGSKAYFSVHFTAGETSLFFNAFDLDSYTEKFGQWEKNVFELYMPKLSPNDEKIPGKQISFFLFNNSPIKCYIDDIRIELIHFRNMDRLLDRSWEK